MIQLNKRQADLSEQLGVLDTKINANRTLFQTECQGGNENEAEKLRETIHTLIDVYLDSYAEIWKIYHLNKKGTPPEEERIIQE